MSEEIRYAPAWLRTLLDDELEGTPDGFAGREPRPPYSEELGRFYAQLIASATDCTPAPDWETFRATDRGTER